MLAWLQAEAETGKKVVVVTGIEMLVFTEGMVLVPDSVILMAEGVEITVLLMGIKVVKGPETLVKMVVASEVVVEPKLGDEDTAKALVTSETVVGPESEVEG